MANEPPSAMLRPDGLQLQEYRRFQGRFWRLQRIAWLGFGAVILAAMLGLTGAGGVFQSQSIAFATARAELPRIARWNAPAEIIVTLAPGTAEGDLLLGRDLLVAFGIERIEPPASADRMTPGGRLLSFAGLAPDAPAIRLLLRPMHAGPAQVELAVGQERRGARLFVLP